MNFNIDSLREAAQWVPFLGLINKDVSGSEELKNVWKHPLTVRLTEAIIIGLVVMYGTVQSTKQEATYLREQLTELKVQVGEIRQQVRQVERDTWERRGERMAWLSTQ